MNIFVLDRDPVIAAEYHCDKHVCKMVVESTQLLSQAAPGFGLKPVYKLTHANHPCALWVRSNPSNYGWLWILANSLANEYLVRYGRVHACAPLIKRLESCTWAAWPELFVQAMPEKYRDSDPVWAYRQYYIHEKAKFAVWRYSQPPPWWPKEKI